METMDPRKFRKEFGFKADKVFAPENCVDERLIDNLKNAEGNKLKTQEFGFLTDAENVTRYYMLDMHWILLGGKVKHTIALITLFIDKAESDKTLELIKLKGQGYPPMKIA